MCCGLKPASRVREVPSIRPSLVGCEDASKLPKSSDFRSLKPWQNRGQALVQDVFSRVHVEQDLQCPQLAVAQTREGQLDEVLLGRDQRALRCLLPRPGA